VSPSERMQLCIDVSASVAFCKRALKALNTLANFSHSAPLVDCSAWKCNPETLVLLRIRHRPAAGYLKVSYKISMIRSPLLSQIYSPKCLEKI